MSFTLVFVWLFAGCVTSGDAPVLRSGQTSEADAYTHFLAGVVLERQGKSEAAIEEYQKAADLMPDSYELNWRLLRTYIDSTDYVNAEKTCSRLLKVEQENVRLWIVMGTIQQELGNQEAASEAFEKALALNPQNEEEFGWLVDAGDRSMDWITAIQVLEKLVELTPDKAEWQAALGMHLSRINDGEGARKAFEKALQLKPDMNELRMQLGLAYLQLNQDQAAVDTLRTYLSGAPGNARAGEMLAGALCRTGQYAAAVEELSKLEDARGEDAGLNLEFMYTLLRAGQARTAADLKATEGTPILSTLFTALARKHAGDPYRPLLDTLDEVEGDIDEECGGVLGTMFFFFGEKDAGEFIINEMKALRDEGVNSMRVDIVLARAYMNVEKHAEAEAVLAKVAEAHPDEKYPHLYLSTVYDELERFRDAEKHLKRCLELNPEDAEAMNNLAYLYAERDMRLDEAEALLKRALEVQPDSGYYLDSLGWVYFRRGDADKAIEYIRRAIVAMDHDDAILRDHLGDAYLMKGDVKRAVSEWRRARRLDPKLEGVQEKIEKHSKKLEKVG
ncbi:MAG: tetratricopeptide repeat protein [Candidatus Hydrogenedentes bacterium]|nr:tetratricopeptide repeat protein [Candidatus Hydrogenedentota bacterium]